MVRLMGSSRCMMNVLGSWVGEISTLILYEHRSGQSFFLTIQRVGYFKWILMR